VSYSIGIDLGGTHVKAVAASSAGDVLARLSAETGVEWKEKIAGLVTQLEAGQQAPADFIGLAAPGLAAADSRSDASLPGRLPGIEGLDWTAFLQRAKPVTVVNDAHAALLAEAWCGAAVPFRHVIMLTLGTGVGGAILADGRLLRGAIGRAGHFGHVSIDSSIERSIAGTPGALELAIGNCSIQQRSRGRFTSTLGLIEAHRAGDFAATAIWTDSVRALGRALVGFINVLDPEAVIIGGGIGRAAGDLFTLLAAELDKFEWRPAGHRVQILPAALGAWAGALGAARFALDHDSQR